MRPTKKRRALRAFQKTTQILNSPQSVSPFSPREGLFRQRPSHESESITHSKAILNLIHYAGVMETFKTSVMKFKGTNNPLNYKEDYNFAEKWEEASKITIQKNDNIYLSAHGVFFLTAMMVMLHKIPMIWQMTVHKILEMPFSVEWFGVGLLFSIIDAFLRMYLIYNDIIKTTSLQQSSKNTFKLKVIGMFIGDLITILVHIYELTTGQHYGMWQLVMSYIVVAIQYQRFVDIYNTLFIILISYKYKNSVNLFGFMTKLFVTLHICSLFVYSVTLLSPNHNWLREIQKDTTDKLTQYIYSVYFTGTTMFTVGYGDILPTNNIEIVIILFVQVLGIVAMGYIISQIGHTLSEMRKSRQDFEQDIQNIDTICNNYQLKSELKDRVRNHIINNRLANEELNVKEENNILMKLNEDLRNEINHVNHLSIMKTSLFFICHWSKKLQTDLSKKLEKFVFSPNERITKLNKLYIVTNGKIDIYTEKKVGEKVFCKKHLKSIFRDPQKEVFSNVYGCTSLFTGKPSQLSAVSKDFAICYALDYDDFFNSIRDDERDFEEYHQTKCKLQAEFFPEKFEVPNLINNRQHFCPSHHLVLKNHQKEVNLNQSRFGLRRNGRKFKKVLLSQPDVFSQSDSDGESLTHKVENEDNSNRQGSVKVIKKAVHGEPRNNQNDSKSYIAFRSYRRKQQSKQDEQRTKAKQMKEMIEHNVVLTSLFEVGKEYQKYFQFGNASKVLAKVNRNEFKYMKEVNSRESHLNWIDLLVFTKKIHTEKKI